MFRFNTLKADLCFKKGRLAPKARHISRNSRYNLKSNQIDLDAYVKELEVDAQTKFQNSSKPHKDDLKTNVWKLKSEGEWTCGSVEYERDSLGMVIGEMPKDVAEDYEKTISSLNVEEKVVKVVKDRTDTLINENLQFVDYDELKKFADQFNIKIHDIFKIENNENASDSFVSMKPSGHSSRKFKDRVKISLQAGNGGNGAISHFKDNKTRRGPPDGGDGGRGGDIIIKASKGCKLNLNYLMPVYRASNGGNGMKGKKNGKNAAAYIIEVPIGTVITECRKPKVPNNKIDNPSSQIASKEFLNKNSSLCKQEDNEVQTNNCNSLDQAGENSCDSLNQNDLERNLTVDKSVIQTICSSVKTDDTKTEKINMLGKNLSNNTKFNDEIDSDRQRTTDGDLKIFGRKSDKKVLSVDELKNLFSPYGVKLDILEDTMAEFSAHHKGYLNVVPDQKQVSSNNKNWVYSNLNEPRRIDLDEDGSYYIAAKGGFGGLGNWKLSYLKKSKYSMPATQGKPGESLTYDVELKIIADVGLVGFPNAGKSTILSKLSRMTPKIASYPFTTLSPHIGVVQFEDYSQYSIADLPGLIEGAHMNRGLGHEFLRHIERTKVICYVLDMSAQDGEDPYEVLSVLFNELDLYKTSMTYKPSLLIANKMDLPNSILNLEKFLSKLKGSKFSSLKVCPISALGNKNLGAAALHMRSLLGVTGELD